MPGDDKNLFLNIINAKPVCERTSKQFIESVWSDKVYGGSAIKIDIFEDNPNPLEKYLVDMEIEYLYGGGLYHIYNIEETSDISYEIKILIPSIMG